MHIDVKRLGRIHSGAGHRITRPPAHYSGDAADLAGIRRGMVGWEYVHIAIDDATRLAYAEVLADETARTAVAFLRRALTFFAPPRRHCGARADRQRRALPLNDPRAGLPRALACATSARARDRPQTNGRVERFIRTHARRLGLRRDLRYSSTERPAALNSWLCPYNH